MRTSTIVVRSVGLTAILLLLGCGAGAATSGSSPEAPAPRAAANAKDTAKEPATVNQRRKKAFEATAEDRLGTAPEGQGVRVGEVAPDFELPDANGAPVKLSALTAKGPVLLVFYRGGWCPYCNFQIHDLHTQEAAFAERGVQLVALSVDKIEESARTDRTYDVGFPLVSDPKLVAHEAFNVTRQASPEEFRRLKQWKIDLEAASGETHHKMAVPSIFLIDRGGVVRWAHLDPEYKVRPTAKQLLKVIDESL